MLSQGPFSYNRFNNYDNLMEKKAKPDFLDMDKDGNKKESMKKAINDKKKCSKCDSEDCKCDDKSDVKESKSYIPGAKVGMKVKKAPGAPKMESVTKEDVIAHLIENNYVSNSVSAEVMFNHITDEYLEEIEAQIMEGWKPLPKEKMARQADKAYGKEQRAVAQGNQAEVNKQMQRRNAMQMPAARKTMLGK